MFVRLLRVALFAVLGALATLVNARAMPESRVWVDTTPEGLRLSLQLPLNRLEYAFGEPLADHPRTVLVRQGEALSRYLLQHVGARSSGVGWQAQRPQLEVTGDDANAELQAVLELRAPAGADLRTPTLSYDAVTHEVRTHQVQVFLRSDWAGGFVGQPPLPLGNLNHDHNSLPIRLQPAQLGSSVLQLLEGGALHIAEGTDHLLFLLLLLLAAPFAGREGRWRDARATPQALRHAVFVVSAFTAGHTITLLLGGGSGRLAWPAQPAEVALALTIAVAALHAWRPLFGAAEAAMALLFGCIHGMAPSASLSGAGLGAWQHAQALFAFNLGIELMQLGVLAGVMPALLLLGRANAAFYGVVRRVFAAGAFVLAALWIVQRAGLAAIETPEWLEMPAALLALLAALLWIAVLAAFLRRRWSAPGRCYP